MGKKLLLFVILIRAQSFLWCNPIAGYPAAKFSELVFNNNNDWTMEIFLPPSYESGSIDSIVFNISGKKAKLLAQYNNGSTIIVFNSDSLSSPLTINRTGDKIVIYSYTNIPVAVNKDSIMFGNYPGATVGAPDSGYSILRYTEYISDDVTFNIDCLTKKPSLGVVNDTTGLAGTLKGHIYDKNNRLINSYTISGGQAKIYLETLLNISPDGSYTTSIFNTIFNKNYLWEEFDNLFAYSWPLSIQPFELNNIHPDTIVYQDIHLTDTCLYCTLVDAVKNKVLPQNNELTLINYPNPFNPSTNFYIKIPNAMSGKKENITIYNVKGQLIRILPFNGSSTIQWDSRDMKGRIMSSGVYYYRLVIDNNVMKNGSMILLK